MQHSIARQLQDGTSVQVEPGHALTQKASTGLMYAHLPQIRVLGEIDLFAALEMDIISLTERSRS
jgi:hypothetical protein